MMQPLNAFAQRGRPEEEQMAMARFKQLEEDATSTTLTMQKSITQNRQAWLLVKQENKELTAAVNSSPGAAKDQDAGKRQTMRAMEGLEKKVHDLRRSYDKILQDKKTGLLRLQNLQESLNDLSKAAGLVAPAPGQLTMSSAVSSPRRDVGAGGGGRPGSRGGPAGGPEARALRQLENRLGKAMLKANEATSIRHTYEQVLEKLQQEQRSYTPHTKALEDVVKARVAEQAALARSQQEVQRARDVAKQELATVETRVATARAEQQAQLQQQWATTRTLGDANQALLTRQYNRPMPGLQHNGLAAGSAQQRLDHLSQPPSSLSLPVGATPQDAMAMLCNAVGCASLEALLQRLLSQQDTLQSLTAMQQAATHQVGALAQQVASAREELETVQQGMRPASTQAALDAVQMELAGGVAQAEAARQAHDQVMHVWVDVRAGVEHLATMVAPLPLPPGHVPVPLSEDTVGDVLAQCHQRLAASLALIKTLPRAAALLEAMLNNPSLGFLEGEGSSAEGLS